MSEPEATQPAAGSASQGSIQRRWLPSWMWMPLIPLAIFAMGFTWQTQEARQQRDAVAVLRKMGATICYENEWKYGATADRSPSWSAWLVHQLGVDYFDAASTAEFPAVTADESLEPVKHLVHLKVLELSGTAITDEGLRHLSGLRSLLLLRLKTTRVTDAGLEHLAGLTALEEIYLESTSVTEAGEDRLKKHLPRCRIYRNPAQPM